MLQISTFKTTEQAPSFSAYKIVSVQALYLENARASGEAVSGREGKGEHCPPFLFPPLAVASPFAGRPPVTPRYPQMGSLPIYEWMHVKESVLLIMFKARRGSSIHTKKLKKFMTHENTKQEQ